MNISLNILNSYILRLQLLEVLTYEHMVKLLRDNGMDLNRLTIFVPPHCSIQSSHLLN
jgi:hypothetical protein